MSDTVILSRRDAANLLTIDECMDSVEAAFKMFAEGKASPPKVLGIVLITLSTAILFRFKKIQEPIIIIAAAVGILIKLIITYQYENNISVCIRYFTNP